MSYVGSHPGAHGPGIVAEGVKKGFAESSIYRELRALAAKDQFSRAQGRYPSEWGGTFRSSPRRASPSSWWIGSSTSSLASSWCRRARDSLGATSPRWRVSGCATPGPSQICRRVRSWSC